MPLNIRAMALALAILCGATVFVTGLANLAWSCYGSEFLRLLASVYPGYKASGSVADLIIGILYALVDGALFGLVFAWLYNRLGGSPAAVSGEVKREAGVNYQPVEPQA